MKKVILSAVMSCALLASTGLMAQDAKPVTSGKAKTECAKKKCSKDKTKCSEKKKKCSKEGKSTKKSCSKSTKK